MGFPILRGLSFTKWGVPLLFSPFRCPESPLSLPVSYLCLQRYFEQPPFLGHQWVMHTSGAAESLAGEGRGFLLWVKRLLPDPSTLSLYHCGFVPLLVSRDCALSYWRGFVCLHAYQRD